MGGWEGVDIDRRTYLGAKQMKDEKRVRTKSKRREQMSFELLSDKEQQHGNVRKSKGAAKAMPRDAAKWPLGCGKERQLKCNICTIDSWLESNQLGGRTPKQPCGSGEKIHLTPVRLWRPVRPVSPV